jgi:hypothetical protein
VPFVAHVPHVDNNSGDIYNCDLYVNWLYAIETHLKGAIETAEIYSYVEAIS